MTNRTEIEKVFKEHYARMYRLALLFLHDDDLARDIVHDVFVSLLEGRFQKSITESYLLRAVRNRCINHIRDCGIHNKIINMYFLNASDYESEEWPDEETVARINEIIEREIPYSARRVIDMRFSQNMKFTDIASAMRVSETAVYRHLRNALIIIRKKLNPNG